jgi:hypothetical protein
VSVIESKPYDHELGFRKLTPICRRMRVVPGSRRSCIRRLTSSPLSSKPSLNRQAQPTYHEIRLSNHPKRPRTTRRTTRSTTSLTPRLLQRSNNEPRSACWKRCNSCWISWGPQSSLHKTSFPHLRIRKSSSSNRRRG